MYLHYVLRVYVTAYRLLTTVNTMQCITVSVQFLPTLLYVYPKIIAMHNIIIIHTYVALYVYIMCRVDMLQLHTQVIQLTRVVTVMGTLQISTKYFMISTFPVMAA